MAYHTIHRRVRHIAPVRLAQDAAYLLDCAKAHRDLGWAPTLTLADAIRQTIDWTRKNINIIHRLPSDYIHKP